MKEDEIYKVAVLRCPACERLIESEIECMQPTNTGDNVLDSCPRCGFLGDYKIVSFLLALLLFCSYSWGDCRGISRSGNMVDYACLSEGVTSLNDNICRLCRGGTCRDIGLGCTSNEYGIATGCDIACSGQNGFPHITGYCCNTQSEVDSVYCALYPTADGCVPSCDSTKWECSTTTERSQTTISSDNVVCFGGDCFGGVYCEYLTKNTTTCTNECGGITTQENSIPIRYEGACNPDNLMDDDECTGVRCISFAETKSYSLYKLCISREIVNGEQKFFPRMVGGGMGNCTSNGYPESNDKDGFAESDSTQIPESCFTMGINCPSPDTTDYASSDNRTSQNGCSCEPYDGLSSVSRIVCPDGSVSVFMGSCDRWNEPPFSSSSIEPPESSSGSENPASSGGALAGDWVNYSQGQEIIGLLGAIANNTLKKSETQNINTINVALDDFTTSNQDVDVPFNRNDSIYNPSYVVDTAGLKNAIFGRVTEENTILDTLLHPASKCPCFTFFANGGDKAQIMGTHISLPKMVFDFTDFHGFDLCHIISVIVTALASVVAFFIGFSIFKNVSQ